MRAKVQKWGNSLGVRLPKKVAEEVHFREGSVVDLSVDDRGRVVLSAAKRPSYTLDELVDRITPRNRHACVEWGPPRGGEVW